MTSKPLLTLIEAGGVNDLPVIMPPAVPMSDALITAIKTLKAAGYRVVKPRKPKVFKRGKNRVGPTIVCEFADGTVTRMSMCTPTAVEALDWERGKRLAQAAYEARARRSRGSLPLVPPPIVRARFEQDGKTLATYDEHACNGGGA